MDPLKPFRRGEKFIPQADFLNDVQEMLKWWHRQIGTKPGQVVVPSEPEIYVRNSDVLHHRKQYSILTLGSQLVGPDSEKSYFFGKSIFEMTPPAASSPFAVLQDAAHKGGGIVKARIGGWSWARVMQNSVAHTWANPVTGEYDFLTSATTGMAKVLWDGDAIVAPLATTLSNAIGPDDLDIDVTATTGWNTLAVDDLFIVTIQSEDILIERVDSGAWRARQRGYNSTTKANHAVNASVTFKAGVVWGLVGWDTRGDTGGGSEPDWSSSTDGVLTASGFQRGAGVKAFINDVVIEDQFVLGENGVTSASSSPYFDNYGVFYCTVANLGDGNEAYYSGSVTSLAGNGIGSFNFQAPIYDGTGVLTRGTTFNLPYGTAISASGPIDDDDPAYAIGGTRGLSLTVIDLAKLTPGGTDGQVTVVGGIVTDYIAPT